MRLVLITGIIILLGTLRLSAQNLVVNGSFESYSEPYCGIMGHDVLTHVSDGWSTANGLSPDLYFTTIDQFCYNYQPNSTYTGLISSKGTELPASGEVMAGMWVYTVAGLEQREYLEGSFSYPLQPGVSYRFRMKLSLADYMEYAAGELGVVFLEQEQPDLDGHVITNPPQFVVTKGLGRTDGWTVVDTVFTCDATYTHFVIGNFHSDALTPLVPNPSASGAPSTYGAYYYVDDVSLNYTGSDPNPGDDGTPLRVSPNPVSSTLYFARALDGPATLEILDRMGSLILADKIEGSSGQLNVSPFPSGLYYLVIRDSNGRVEAAQSFLCTSGK